MKTLIYMPINGIKPVGGPAGYLYNLKAGLDSLGSQEVFFLEATKENEESLVKKISRKLPKHLRVFLKNMYFHYKKNYSSKEAEQDALYHEYQELIFGETRLPENYNEYDVIHFHTTFELYRERKQLEKYNGKVILNSHSPQPAHEEYITLFDNHPKRDQVFNIVKEADKYAFDHADIILFPCKYAEEPYYNNWDIYKEIHRNNESKYHYLITGIRKCEAKVNKEEIRKAYKIPKDAFVVCYVGRHSKIKGYDSLKTIGSIIQKKYNNLYFLIAGQEGPLFGLENEKWIEVGWTDDPHSIIKSSDLFILPNKETYFDLIMLEVMSLGVPVLATNTGGNKYFLQQGCNGVKLYSTEDECIASINELVKEREYLVEMGKENEKYFDDNLNEKIFAKRYIDLMRLIVNEK